MSERIRVLYVIDSLTPGGAETSLAAMAPHLTSGGVQLDVAYLVERPGVHDELRSAGASLHHVDASRFGRIGELRRLMKRLEPDVVHTTLFEADQAGRVAGRTMSIPVMSSLVSTGFEIGPWSTMGGLRSRAALVTDVSTARLATAFHAVSEPVAEFMADRYRLPRSRFTVIPRGRSPEALGRRTPERRSHVRRSLGLTAETPLVLNVGRQVAPKSQLTLIDAIPAIAAARPDVQVYVVGQHGPETAAIERRVDELGVRHLYLNLGHRNDIADLMVAADVVTLPSRREGFPGTLVEALALECPIVASDIPTVRSVVGSGAGQLATLTSPGDSEELAHGVIQVLEGALPSTVQAGRAEFERSFTIGAVAEQMHRMYSRLR